MKIVDVNIVLYVTNTGAKLHQPVKAWWDSALGGEEPVGLTWHTIIGFVRIATSPKAFPLPLTVDQALAKVASWIAHSNIRIVQETTQHYRLFAELLRAVGTGANLTVDAHMAAIAISHGATLVSCDTDFGRFRQLRWENPGAVP